MKIIREIQMKNKIPFIPTRCAQINSKKQNQITTNYEMDNLQYVHLHNEITAKQANRTLIPKS